MNKCRVTLPAEVGMDDKIKEIIKCWGADAIRNSDGTELPQALTAMDHKVYATYKLCRNDQKWALSHMDQLQQVYLMTEQITAEATNLQIDILDGYFGRQVQVNHNCDAKEWWEVIDRTTGKVLASEKWCYDEKTGLVTIADALPWHVYTVTFLAYVVWDPVHMYNHLTNEWTTPEQRPYDVRHPETRAHVLEHLDRWLQENPHVDVVRFTTFFYNFTLIFNDKEKEKYVDWFGYSATVSVEAILAFEKAYGYRPRPEDFVDAGYHNTPFKVPSKVFKDWMAFQEQFVCGLAKECVDLCHKHNKEAMMFLGDHWIGTEPYGEVYKTIGMDAVVGSVGSGATCRMISDIPGVRYTEGRFLPYFFPDNFSEGDNPGLEAEENWLQARRAIMRKPLDRMGYGGYLSLAAKFPDFIDQVGSYCNQFRDIHNRSKGNRPYTATFKVAVLNAWGSRRTWMTNMVAHAKWYKKIYSYVGVIEALSGMPVEVVFISFDDIKKEGIPKDIGVIINAGDAETAWSGDTYWLDSDIIGKVREFVHNGGGFIGVGEPSAIHHQGRYFQLADVLGVEKERGFTLSYTNYDSASEEEHFILEGLDNIDLGEDVPSIRHAKKRVKTLVAADGDTKLAVNAYGSGRSVYMTGLPYSADNARLLLRAIFWVAGKEEDLYRWYSENPMSECTAFEESGYVAVYNNGPAPIDTVVYRDKNNRKPVHLAGGEVKWFSIEETFPL